MTEKTISPGLKAALEFGPVAAFFAGYFWLKDRTFTFAGTEYHGFIAVTAAFVPLMVITTLLLWRLTGKLSKMQIATVVLVVVFGGLSVWLNDERFIKMKPTIIYLLFAGFLAFGLWRGQSYVQEVIGEALPMTQEGWMILTRRLALFFVAMALANEVVRTMLPTSVWVTFKSFVLLLAPFGFFMSQGGLLKRHSTEKDQD